MDAYEALAKARESRKPMVLAKTNQIEKQIGEAAEAGLFTIRVPFSGLDNTEISMIEKYFTDRYYVWGFYRPDNSSDYAQIAWEVPLKKPECPPYPPLKRDWFERND